MVLELEEQLIRLRPCKGFSPPGLGQRMHRIGAGPPSRFGCKRAFAILSSDQLDRQLYDKQCFPNVTQ